MKLHELNLIFVKANKTKNDFDLFFETGSYVGETIGEVKSEFKELISVEITEKYSAMCKRKFTNDANVKIVKGDSVLELPELIERNNDKKILFFLDAHCSAGDTGKNDKDVPMIEELKIIEEKYLNEGLVIIDDADMFDKNFRWSECRDNVLTWEGINEENIFGALKDRVENYFYYPDIRGKNKKRLIILLKSKI